MPVFDLTVNRLLATTTCSDAVEPSGRLEKDAIPCQLMVSAQARLGIGDPFDSFKITGYPRGQS